MKKAIQKGFNFQASSTPRFYNLNPIDILGQLIIAVGCTVDCRVFSSNPDSKLLVIRSKIFPYYDNQKCLQTVLYVPYGSILPQVRTVDLYHWDISSNNVLLIKTTAISLHLNNSAAQIQGPFEVSVYFYAFLFLFCPEALRI